MKAVWKGSISFGLVNVPVKMYTATSTRDLSFNMLHSKDKGRIHYKKFCSKCGQEVSKDEIVKGYPISKDEYVVLTDDDFAKVPLKSLKTIEIKQFFEPSELGVIYYNNFYYLAPEKGGEKPYYILKEAMKSTNSMGIGKLSFRNREHLIGLKSFDGGLLLAQLYYIDEVRGPEEVPGWNPSVDVNDEEMDLAVQLINHMKKPLKLEEYKDEYKEALMELIEAKLAGKKVTVSEEVAEAESLVDALKSSLEKAKESES